MTRGKARKPLFEEQTPVPHGVSQVTLFEDIWRDKIVVEHPEMAGHLQDEMLTILVVRVWPVI